MTKQYNSNYNDDLLRAQEIVMYHTTSDYGRRERRFSQPLRGKRYKIDKDFTPEERKKILARVSEVGATRAADEFGTRRWVIMQWLDNLEKFGSIDNPNQKSKNNSNNNNNKKRSFDREKQNSLDEKISEQKTPLPEPVKQNISKKAEAEIEKTTLNDFKDFEFNFSGVLQKNENNTAETVEKEKKEISSNSAATSTTTSSAAKLKKSEDFTLEQREEILKLSDEIGLKKAALQAETKIEVIKYWRKIRKNKTLAQAQAQKQDADFSPESENQVLKAQILELEAEIKKLTKEINEKI